MAEDNTETADVSTDDTSESTDDKATLLSEGDNKDQSSTDTETSQKSGEDDTANKDDDNSKDSDEAGDGDEGDKEDGDDDKAVEYEDFTVPEGEEINEENMGAFKELASSLNDGKGLSQEDAQKLIDLQTKLSGATRQAQTEQWETIYSEWRGEIAADKEIGGKNQPEAMRTAMKAAQHYGDPELVNVLNTNPQYGSNPALVRFLHRVGKTLTEDQVSPGGRQGGGSGKDASEILYPEKES